MTVQSSPRIADDELDGHLKKYGMVTGIQKQRNSFNCRIDSDLRKEWKEWKVWKSGTFLASSQLQMALGGNSSSK